MPSFSDNIFIFVLALLLFGPKRLPKLARELGKWVGEFRRASNDFKMQMEDELRSSEQAERDRKISAMEAAAPATPALDEPKPAESTESRYLTLDSPERSMEAATPVEALPEPAPAEAPTEPLPIASSGELNLMPPATGLPQGRSPRATTASSDPLGGLIDSIPVADENKENHHG
ncbi:twin-arginine translocase TatA/TatE family subunit [Granulicella cerasi]|uniref:Twin-arginine translocase TatA/TatE family subunit n=1 Tax=Granulicella cerasi TaxID=741063 RepID=A0ABW1Z6R4_9BACT|nr:twin-arginine translocase TatA/TatE family subunit [Granulicella cerasi]